MNAFDYSKKLEGINQQIDTMKKEIEQLEKIT